MKVRVRTKQREQARQAMLSSEHKNMRSEQDVPLCDTPNWMKSMTSTKLRGLPLASNEEDDDRHSAAKGGTDL